MRSDSSTCMLASPLTATIIQRSGARMFVYIVEVHFDTPSRSIPNPPPPTHPFIALFFLLITKRGAAFSCNIMYSIKRLTFCEDPQRLDGAIGTGADLPSLPEMLMWWTLGVLVQDFLVGLPTSHLYRIPPCLHSSPHTSKTPSTASTSPPQHPLTPPKQSITISSVLHE